MFTCYLVASRLVLVPMVVAAEGSVVVLEPSLEAK